VRHAQRAKLLGLCLSIGVGAVFRREQKGNQCGYIAGLPDTAHRMLFMIYRAQLILTHCDPAWADAVNAYRGA